MTRRRLTSLQRAAIFQAKGGRCHICGMKIRAPGEKWELEHVIPLAMGGADDESNMKPAHVKCHAAKSKTDAGDLAKVDRIRAGHIGAKRSTWPTGREGKWKQKIGGRVVLR